MSEVDVMCKKDESLLNGRKLHNILQTETGSDSRTEDWKMQGRECMDWEKN